MMSGLSAVRAGDVNKVAEDLCGFTRHTFTERRSGSLELGLEREDAHVAHLLALEAVVSRVVNLKRKKPDSR